MQRYLEKTTRTVDDATGQIVHEQTSVIRIAPLVLSHGWIVGHLKP